MPTSRRAVRDARPTHFLKAGDYWRGWILGMFTGTARWLEFLALGVFAYTLTESPQLVALLAIVRFAPFVLLGFHIGVLTDRIDRKVGLVACLGLVALSSVTLAVLAAYDLATYPAVLVATFASGLVWLTDMPLRRRLMLDVIDPAQVGRAMGVDGITNYVTRGVGPVLGGLLLQWFDVVGVFALNGALYVVCLLLALGFGGRGRRRRPEQKPVAAAGERPRRARRLLSDAHFCIFLAITIVYNLFCFPVIAMLPVFLKKDFGMSPAEIGSLAAFEGVGGLVGAIAIGMAIRPRGLFPVYLAGPIIHSLSVLTLSIVFTPGMTVACLLVLAFGGAMFAATQYSLVYTMAEPEQRGRASGYVLICIGCATIGFWIAGTLFDALESDVALMMLALMGLLPLMLLGALLAVIGLARPAAGRA